MEPKKIIVTLTLACIALLFLIPAYNASRDVRKGFKSNDIRFIWQDGASIANGVNPYSRIHASDMRKNDKYSTYFPGFFLLVSATHYIGVTEYKDFIKYWRPVNLGVLVVLGTVVLYAAWGAAGFWWGVFAGTFVWFNRWTIQVVNSGQIDILASLLLVLGILQLDKEKDGNSTRGWLLVGASLAVKQMAIFAVPLLLLYEVQHSGFRKTLSRLLPLSIVPFICCLPFLLDDPIGLIKSVLFSATRTPGGTFNIESYDQLLDLVGLPAKVLMLGLIGILAWVSLSGKLSRASLVLLSLVVFVCFNSVLLKQYISWLVPLVPLAAINMHERRRNHTEYVA